MDGPRRVALLLPAGRSHQREVIAGIADHLRDARMDWDLLVEDDLHGRLSDAAQSQVDGIIADFDDPAVRGALRSADVPVVAIGSPAADPRDDPIGVAYVSTDNAALVTLSHDHLVETGLAHLAMYSLPPQHAWVGARERAFARLAPSAEIHRGSCIEPLERCDASDSLSDWLRALPKPVGIIAVNDAQARRVVHACVLARIAVPDEVAVVGIDDDDLTQRLTRIPLSSVRHAADEIGRTAAHLLAQAFQGERIGGRRIVIAPAGLTIRASSQHRAPAFSAPVMKARYCIRQFACRGFKNAQVAEYVGVSRSALEGAFRAELGTTLHRELLWQRIRSAQQLLRKGLSAAEIAARCGFTTEQYMHAVFKRELAMTPAAYRRAGHVRATSRHTLVLPEEP